MAAKRHELQQTCPHRQEALLSGGLGTLQEKMAGETASPKCQILNFHFKAATVHKCVMYDIYI